MYNTFHCKFEEGLRDRYFYLNKDDIYNYYEKTCWSQALWPVLCLKRSQLYEEGNYDETIVPYRPCCSWFMVILINVCGFFVATYNNISINIMNFLNAIYPGCYLAVVILTDLNQGRTQNE